MAGILRVDDETDSDDLDCMMGISSQVPDSTHDQAITRNPCRHLGAGNRRDVHYRVGERQGGAR